MCVLFTCFCVGCNFSLVSVLRECKSSVLTGKEGILLFPVVENTPELGSLSLGVTDNYECQDIYRAGGTSAVIFSNMMCLRHNQTQRGACRVRHTSPLQGFT